MKKTKSKNKRKQKGAGVPEDLFKSIVYVVCVLLSSIFAILGTIVYVISSKIGSVFLAISVYMTKLLNRIQMSLNHFANLLRSLRRRVKEKNMMLMNRIKQNIHSIKSNVTSPQLYNGVNPVMMANSQEYSGLQGYAINQPLQQPCSNLYVPHFLVKDESVNKYFVQKDILTIYFDKLNSESQFYFPILKGNDGLFMHFGIELEQYLPINIVIEGRIYIKQQRSVSEEPLFIYTEPSTLTTPVSGVPMAQVGGGGVDEVISLLIPSNITFVNEDVERSFKQMKSNVIFVIEMALNHFIFNFLIPFSQNVYDSIGNVNIFKHYSCVSAERTKRSVVFRTPTINGSSINNPSNEFYKTVPLSTGGKLRKKTIRKKRRGGGEVNFGLLKEKASSAKATIANKMSTLKQNMSKSMQRQNICIMKEKDKNVYRITRKRNFGIGDTSLVYACDKNSTIPCQREAIMSCADNKITIKNQSNENEFFTFEGNCDTYNSYLNSPFVSTPTKMSSLFGSIAKLLENYPSLKNEVDNLLKNANVDVSQINNKTNNYTALSNNPNTLMKEIEQEQAASTDENTTPESIDENNTPKSTDKNSTLELKDENTTPESTDENNTLELKDEHTTPKLTDENNTSELKNEHKLLNNETSVLSVGGGESFQDINMNTILQGLIKIIMFFFTNKSQQGGGEKKDNDLTQDTITNAVKENIQIDIDEDEITNIVTTSQQFVNFINSIHFFQPKTLNKIDEHFERLFNQSKQTSYYVTLVDNHYLFHKNDEQLFSILPRL